jgi:iron(III) transport system ATP-binding protein
VKAASLEVRGLTKTFADKVVLDDVSISVARGEFLVLLGPSGSGKTTLLRCLAGIERADAGEIEIDDRLVAGPRTFVTPDKRHLSMVFQDYALWPHMSVRQNVGYALAKWAALERRRRVDDLLERVGIAALGERYPNQLSGGEQQRVALARALAADVGLVLFDEPLSNLDADRREQLRIEISTLTREVGVTAVYITHDQGEAFAMADQICVLNHGRVVQCGPPESIYREPANAFVARFTGLAADLPAELLCPCGPRGVDVALPFAHDHRVRAHAPVALEMESRVRLYVRAAGVRLSNASHEGIAATVRDVAFIGRGYEHVVQVGTHEVITKVFSETRHERDSAVRVCFDAASSFVLADNEGGDRQ